MAHHTTTTREQLDADEAFARRLQRGSLFAENEDQGLLPNGDGTLGYNVADAQQRSNTQAIRVNVLNESLREVTSSRVAISALVLVNVPQVIAAACVLYTHWDDESACDKVHRIKWRIWASVTAARLSFHLISVLGLVLASHYNMPRDSRTVRMLMKARNFAEAAGLIWFLVGNMWLFGDSDSDICKHANRSPIYVLCLSMIIINYIQICLPCVIAILLVPVLCFCLPCVIQCLRWLRIAPGQENSKGASIDVIEKIPTVKFRDLVDRSPAESGGAEVDETCPICLSNFEAEDNLRVLHCRHHFHKSCVDEWLAVNSTCPSCRSNVAEEGEKQKETTGSSGRRTSFFRVAEEDRQLLRSAEADEADIEMSPIPSAELL